MFTRSLHIGLVIFVFALYTIPLCQCAEMMKASSEHSCCSASSTPKACTEAHDCCPDGSVNAEKMNTEKSFESAQVSSISSPELVSFVQFPPLLVSSQFVVPNRICLAYSPPTQAFLQVFLI
jgi:hypothetical protein